MTSTHRKYLLITILSWSLTLLLSIASDAQPLGRIFTQNYGMTDYNAGSQNWDFVQGTDGLIYAGNNDGVLQFDGLNWKLIPVANSTAVRSLAIDSTGIIYAGAEGDFGYLAPNPQGNLIYHSLLPLVDSAQKVTFVWRTHANSHGVYFRTTSTLFRLHQGKMSAIEASTRFDRSFQIGDALYITERNVGIHKIVGDKLEFVKGSEYYAEDRLYIMLPYDSPTKFLMVTRSKGLHVFDMRPTTPSERFVNINAEMPSYFDFSHKKNVVYSAIPLPDNTYAFASLNQGVLIIDKHGKNIHHLTDKKGLSTDISICLMLDKQNGLWVGLNDGIARCEIFSPWRRWTESEGLSSTVSNVQYFNDELYVATLHGLYKATKNTFQSITDLEEFQVWKLISFQNPRNYLDNRLLIACSSGIYQLKADLAEPLLAKRVIGLCLFQKKSDPFVVYAGVSGGMHTLLFENNKWIDLGKIEGVESDVNSITEDRQHNIWVTTADQEVKRFIFSKPTDASPLEIVTYGADKGVIPANYLEISYMNGRVLLGTDKGLLMYNPDKDIFEPSNALGKEFALGKSGVQTVVQARGDEAWVASASVSTFKGTIAHVDMGSGEVNNRPFLRLPTMEIMSMYNAGDTALWLSGEHLYRYDIKKGGNLKEDTTFTTSIRKVIANGDSIIFGGNYSKYISQDSILRISISQDVSEQVILDYSQNTLEFHYAGNHFDQPSTTEYSYKLENHDDNWSAWTKDIKQRFTDLSNGNYVFKVKARNIYDDESKIGSFAFSITPPFYKTTFAFILYVTAFVLLIILIVNLYSRRLVNEKKKLEVLVKDRTLALEKQQKKTLDSINYAQRILTALHTPKDYIKDFFPESFVLFKPKDIVSGDFFWMEEVDGRIIIAVVDCTGHGIPGAFMSVIGNAVLKEVVNFYQIREPDLILEAMNEMVKENLHQDETANQDGMDLSLCILDLREQKLYFSGARNPLVAINRNTGEMKVYKGNRRSIGGKRQGADKSFNKEVIDINSNTTFYMYSDGYQDQFGGEDGNTKLTAKRFRNLLQEASSLPVTRQEQHLSYSLEQWQGAGKQIDDILVVGFKVPPLD